MSQVHIKLHKERDHPDDFWIMLVVRRLVEDAACHQGMVVRVADRWETVQIMSPLFVTDLNSLELQLVLAPFFLFTGNAATYIVGAATLTAAPSTQLKLECVERLVCFHQ